MQDFTATVRDIRTWDQDFTATVRYIRAWDRAFRLGRCVERIERLKMNRGASFASLVTDWAGALLEAQKCALADSDSPGRQAVLAALYAEACELSDSLR